MITVHVLISRNKIVQNFGKCFTVGCVQRYTEYLMLPYVQLGYISFCSFSELEAPIDGKSSPTEITDKINELYGMQQKYMAKLIHDASEMKNLFEEIINTISGRFCYSSFFYDSTSDSTYINHELLVKIKNTPEDYVISIINVTR